MFEGKVDVSGAFRSAMSTRAQSSTPRLSVKSHGGERCGNVRTMIPAGKVERGERKQTVDEVSKAD
jgi:hypothetical protein